MKAAFREILLFQSMEFQLEGQLEYKLKFKKWISLMFKNQRLDCLIDLKPIKVFHVVL